MVNETSQKIDIWQIGDKTYNGFPAKDVGIKANKFSTDV